MNAIREAWEAKKTGTTKSLPPRHSVGVYKELCELGWEKNLDEPRDPPEFIRQQYGKKVVYPFWVDPETGDDNLRFWEAVERTYERIPKDPPSDHAVRVLAALEGKPELYREVKALMEGSS